MNLSDFYLIDQIRILYEASFIKHRVKRIDACLKGLIREESRIKLKALKETWEFEMRFMIISTKAAKKLSFQRLISNWKSLQNNILKGKFTKNL